MAPRAQAGDSQNGFHRAWNARVGNVVMNALWRAIARAQSGAKSGETEDEMARRPGNRSSKNVRSTEQGLPCMA
jgi:hypothetical protein